MMPAIPKFIFENYHFFIFLSVRYFHYYRILNVNKKLKFAKVAVAKVYTIKAAIKQLPGLSLSV